MAWSLAMNGICGNACGIMDHGKNYNLVNSESQELGFRWLHTRFGSNFRLTEMQSAIGRIQLQKLSNWVEDRNRNAGIFLMR